MASMPVTLLTLLLVFGSAIAEAVQVCQNDVRSTAPASRFVLNGDNTVTDVATGLTWKRCSEGQSGTECDEGEATQLTWQRALQTASDSRFAGYDDWRVPNLSELESIVERGCTSPAIDLTVFPNTRDAAAYWTSTPNASAATLVGIAWRVSFLGGATARVSMDSASAVRLVRGGL